jgi:hypothetical protein
MSVLDLLRSGRGMGWGTRVGMLVMGRSVRAICSSIACRGGALVRMAIINLFLRRVSYWGLKHQNGVVLILICFPFFKLRF